MATSRARFVAPYSSRFLSHSDGRWRPKCESSSQPRGASPNMSGYQPNKDAGLRVTGAYIHRIFSHGDAELSTPHQSLMAVRLEPRVGNRMQTLSEYALPNFPRCFCIQRDPWNDSAALCLRLGPTTKEAFSANRASGWQNQRTNC